MHKTMISEGRRKWLVHLMDKGASLAFPQGRGVGMTVGDLADVFFDEENCLSGRMPADGAFLALLRSALEDAGCQMEKQAGQDWYIVWRGAQMMGRVGPERYVLKLMCIDDAVASVLSLSDRSENRRRQ